MARRLFPARLLQLPNGDPAVNGPFRLFTDPFSGSPVTDVKLPDGVTDPPKNGDYFLAGADGNSPWLRGPDTGTGSSETVALYIDTGVGVRYELFAVDSLSDTVRSNAAVQAFIARGDDIDTSNLQKVVRWNPGGTQGSSAFWDTRDPADPFGVLFLSTNDPNATPPADPNLKVGDRWARHTSAATGGNAGGFSDGF